MIQFMLTLQDRFALALSHAGTNISKLKSAKDIGMTYQALKKIEDGHTNKLDAKNCATLARLLGVDVVWLATGDGEMIPKKVTFVPPELSEQEQRLIRLWGQIGPIYQAGLIDGLSKLVAKMSADAESAASELAGMVSSFQADKPKSSERLTPAKVLHLPVSTSHPRMGDGCKDLTTNADISQKAEVRKIY